MSSANEGDDPEEGGFASGTVTAESRLIEAASAGFRRHGYARCSTRQIADAAGVAETLLFRHFGSKARLFDIAIRRSFEEALTRFVAPWADGDASRGEPGSVAHAERFMHELCGFVSQERDALLVLMTVNAFDHAAPACSRTVPSALAALEKLVETHVVGGGDASSGAPPSARAVMALLLGTLVLDDSVWSDTDRPPVGATTAEITAMALWGVSRRGRRRKRDH